jgi:hypothetical protein
LIWLMFSGLKWNKHISRKTRTKTKWNDGFKVSVRIFNFNVSFTCCNFDGWRRSTLGERNSVTNQRQLWRRPSIMIMKSLTILDFLMFAIPLKLNFTALSFNPQLDATVYLIWIDPDRVIQNHARNITVEAESDIRVI